MIRGILQFALRIAFRCVLHRCENRDIHGYQLFGGFFGLPWLGVALLKIIV